jgi:hypothetical protein
MATRCGFGLAAMFLLAHGLLCADVKLAKAEPNLEKRSKLAVDAAVAALKQAREAYRNGEIEPCRKFIAESLEAASLSAASIKESGKDPRRSPKWFKRAEMELRELIRRVDSFSDEMSFADRPLLEELRAKVVQVHDELLTGLMEGKRK